VRTCHGQKPQEGITFLLVDMDSPGISVRPVLTMDGEHEFNEVIFDGVRVPKVNRVGAENDGWGVAKHLMRLARTNNTNSGLLLRSWRALESNAQTYGARNDLLFANRMADLETELRALEALELRFLSSGRLSGDDEAGSSVMKTVATELHQRITELSMEAAGPLAFSQHQAGDGSAALALRKYLTTRAASIYSGTNEIHRNVIARHLCR